MNKAIDKIDFREIGNTQKPHGLQGELIVSLLEGMESTMLQLKWLFLEMDGLPLPFEIESIKFRTNTQAVLKLKLIENQDDAKLFSGNKVLIDFDEIILEEEDFSPELFIGFTLIDQKIGTIGSILAVDNYSGNYVLTVQYQNNEVLIPFNEDLIISLEPETQTIVLACPPGIFEMN